MQSVENCRSRWSAGYPPVFSLCAARVQTPVRVHSRRRGGRCPPLSTDYPPDIHGVCPRTWGQRRNATGSSSPEPSTGNPHPSTAGGQICDAECLSTAISPEVVHICAEHLNGYPPLGTNPWGQPVDNVGTIASRRVGPGFKTRRYGDSTRPPPERGDGESGSGVLRPYPRRDAAVNAPRVRCSA